MINERLMDLCFYLFLLDLFCAVVLMIEYGLFNFLKGIKQNKVRNK